MESIDYPAHPDLAQAVQRLHATLGGNREIRHLPQYLCGGEQVEELAVGTCVGDFGTGVLAVTDRRVLFVIEGWYTQRFLETPLYEVSGLEDRKRFTGFDIEIFVAGQPYPMITIEGIHHVDAQRFLTTARAVLARHAAGGTPTVPRQAPAERPHRADLISQLERLGSLRARGVLSEEEFTRQKANILGQM